MKYNWQKADWPNFQYNSDSVQQLLFSIIEKVGFIDLFEIAVLIQKGSGRSVRYELNLTNRSST